MSVPPLLSVIVVTPDRYETVRQTIRHLREQSLRERMEIVLVAPSRETLDLEEKDLDVFCAWQLVVVGTVRSNAAGYAAGVRHARAPVVVFAEDHSYPGTGWAAALERAHREDWAAVGPVVANANPTGAIAWADFMLGYGPWLDPTPRGSVDYLPGHNSSYKRDILLAYEPDLESWLEAESTLHWDLKSKGHGLLLEPAAKTHHFNYSLVSAWLAATYLNGRTFAGRRVHGAGMRRRLVFALASPLIPLVRLRRCLRDLRRSAPRPALLQVLPALAVALVVSAAGEAVGYALGIGDAAERVSRYEFHRDRQVNTRDRLAMAEARFWV